jgi:hypothetical protein
MNTQTQQPKPVVVRLKPEVAAEVDRRRGLIPRDAYVNALINVAIKDFVPLLTSEEQ